MLSYWFHCSKGYFWISTAFDCHFVIVVRIDNENKESPRKVSIQSEGQNEDHKEDSVSVLNSDIAIRNLSIMKMNSCLEMCVLKKGLGKDMKTKELRLRNYWL